MKRALPTGTDLRKRPLGNEYSENFSTHLLTVLTTSDTIQENREEIGGEYYEYSEIYTEIYRCN